MRCLRRKDILAVRPSKLGHQSRVDFPGWVQCPVPVSGVTLISSLRVSSHSVPLCGIGLSKFLVPQKPRFLCKPADPRARSTQLAVRWRRARDTADWQTRGVAFLVPF